MIYTRFKGTHCARVLKKCTFSYLAICCEVPHHDGVIHGGGDDPLLVGTEVDLSDGILVSLELLEQLRVSHVDNISP